jgi:hypothetical protein
MRLRNTLLAVLATGFLTLASNVGASAQSYYVSPYGYGYPSYYYGGSYYDPYYSRHHVVWHRGLHWSPDAGLHWGTHYGWHSTRHHYRHHDGGSLVGSILDWVF